MEHESARFDAEVELTLLPAAENKMGRPLFSGDRAPHVYLEGREWMAVFYMTDRELLRPGETARVRVGIAFPRDWADRLQVGMPLSVRSCGWTVGEGIVIALSGPEVGMGGVSWGLPHQTHRQHRGRDAKDRR